MNHLSKQKQMDRQIKQNFTYDKIFHCQKNFNPKAHRDDRQHSKFIGLNLAKQEEEKLVGNRSSSEYGRRHDQSNLFDYTSFVRIEHIQNDFYRNNGIFYQ